MTSGEAGSHFHAIEGTWRKSGTGTSFMAKLVLFDGTLWRDDEMIAAGVGSKTGRRMGHISMDGGDGSMAAFAPLGVGRKIYVHINNTNPVLLADSAERAAVEAAGWEVAHDGMELTP